MQTRMQKWEWDRVNPEDFYRKLESIAEALEKIAVSIDELKKK